MNFQFTKEQELVRQMVREFAENEIKPIAAESDQTGEFPMENFKKLGKYGCFGIPFPTEYEGAGGDYLSYILAVEEISKACATTGIALSVQTSLCMGAIWAFSNEEQK
ncbi:acyl-CoA dehydrogenase family protein, partial [Clostridium aestuarii]